jgi:hypothetical protein
MINLPYNYNSFRCPSLTDKALKYLCDFPKIENLNLSFCVKITDTGVALLLSKLKNLRQLNLHNCTKLTQTILDKISRDPSKLQVDLYNANVLPLFSTSYHKKITSAAAGLMSTQSGSSNS